MVVYNKGALIVQVPVCDLLSDQERTIYGLRHVKLLNSGWVIKREKKERGNSYRGGHYTFYGNFYVLLSVPRTGLVVL